MQEWNHRSCPLFRECSRVALACFESAVTRLIYQQSPLCRQEEPDVSCVVLTALGTVLFWVHCPVLFSMHWQTANSANSTVTELSDLFAAVNLSIVSADYFKEEGKHVPCIVRNINTAIHHQWSRPLFSFHSSPKCHSSPGILLLLLAYISHAPF